MQVLKTDPSAVTIMYLQWGDFGPQQMFKKIYFTTGMMVSCIDNSIVMSKKETHGLNPGWSVSPTTFLRQNPFAIFSDVSLGIPCCLAADFTHILLMFTAKTARFSAATSQFP